ncbi:hypothetical protein IFM12275_09590 [Nocardia sputorum]|uniref:Uncharacterized protein n=2 Tax=Nocardiaceae TaxID=85025 RepID=A0ABN6U3N0_9NOCA|nr:hypothetical protein IFM12275_09590 [Nocardia sputorum]BDT99615.1 hypothetical protein IFM12276_26440 [Nocardia sputorum]
MRADAAAAVQRPRDNAATGKIVLSFADAHTGPHPAADPVAAIELCDRALSAGRTVGQEGRIGGADGRFAYLQTEHHSGTVIEISDVGGTEKFVFDLVKMAAAHWDGSHPIRTIDTGLLGGDPAVMTAMLEALG